MDIESLLASVSDEDMAKIKGIAESLMNNTESKEQKPQQLAPKQDIMSSFPLNADMMQKIMSVVGRMNKDDYRTRLIYDLKPMLSDDRKKKADEAVKFLQLMDVLPLLRGIF